MMFKHGKRLLPTEALARLEAASQPTTPAPVDERIKQAVDSVEQFMPFDGIDRGGA